VVWKHNCAEYILYILCRVFIPVSIGAKFIKIDQAVLELYSKIEWHVLLC